MGNDVLSDLNASVAISRLPAEVKAFLAPRIVTQPPAQVTGYAERSIHIPAVADGRQLSYRWTKGGSTVAGATSTILHLADLNASTDPGYYSLVVTNPFGSVTSSATQLTVATVVPNDVDLPVLTLNGQKSISLLTGTAWQEPGYSATDDLDGNLTAEVDVNGTVNASTPRGLLHNLQGDRLRGQLRHRPTRRHRVQFHRHVPHPRRDLPDGEPK